MEPQQVYHQTKNLYPFLSIGTTCYNGGKYLPILLNSLREQNIDSSVFEWVIIDNASNDDSYNIAENIQHNNPDLNIRLIRFNKNRGPGGGRNGFFENAQGKWLIMVDSDDTLVPNILPSLVNELNNAPKDLDVLEFAVLNYNWDTKKEKSTIYENNTTEIMSGREYVISQQFDWGPWSRALRHEYIMQVNLRFAENEILDSPDFSISAVLNANKIKYWPKEILRYSIWEGQNSGIILGNLKLTESAYKRSMRMRKIGEQEMPNNPVAANIVLQHHYYCHISNLKYYLWHLSWKNMVNLLRKYPPHMPCSSKLLSFSQKHVIATATTLWIVKPLFTVLREIYIKFNK